MKKFFLIAFSAMLLTGLSITASYAAAAQCPPNSGCPCDISDAMKHNADAQRVKDRAYSRQIIKQNDNSVGMTCFDYAMTLSTGLGQIFSDKPYSTGFGMANGFGAPNTKVFGTAIYDASAGAGRNLGNDFKDVVQPILASHASNFGDSLSAFLGATIMGYMTTFMAPINAAISTINGYVTQVNSYMSQLNSFMTSLQTVLDLLGAAMPAVVPMIVGMINMWWGQIQSIIDAGIAAVQALIKTAMDYIKTLITNAMNSFVANFAGPSGPCSRISQLWGQLPSPLGAAASMFGFVWPGLFRPIEGGGLEQGTPYLSWADFLSGMPLGVGTDLASELSNTTNAPLLAAALADITGSGVLAAPGNSPSWPATPDLTGMSVAGIIGLIP